MRAGWAILAGLALGGLAWWLGRDADHPRPTASTGRAGARTGKVQVEDARSLYRWRDDAGNLQITDTPPPGHHRYERVAREPQPGIKVEEAR